MKILITGAGGFIGSALCAQLESAGHAVRRLSRNPSGEPGEFAWQPEEGSIDTRCFEGVDAVVHLAGESVSGIRWTKEKKRKIRESRIQGTTLLVRSMAALDVPPGVFICASAAGFYGNRGEEVLTEASAPGKGFLAELCREWEAAAMEAAPNNIRVVNARFGMVLSPGGGALKAMLPIFKSGGGGVVGGGRQYVSWLTLRDAVSALIHCLADSGIAGPVNFTAPEPVTNGGFTKALANVLGRPAVMKVPAFAVRLALGEMADEMLLASMRILPQKLLDSGFTFADPFVEPALRFLLK